MTAAVEPTWLKADWMQTFTGRVFRPFEPDIDHVDILDIAHALSLICRFGGHTFGHYSVAEHCVLMSYAVRPENALWALLHDATEAYMGDVIRPVKRHLPDYVAAEDRLMRVICDRFGLPPDPPQEVQDADNRILLDERDVVLPNRPAVSWGAVEDLEPLRVHVEGWSPVRAEMEYLARFNALRDARDARV